MHDHDKENAEEEEEEPYDNGLTPFFPLLLL